MEITRNKQPEIVEDRGVINLILPEDIPPIYSVLFITSKAGTTRSNHYHKEDSHYIYVQSGKMEYYEKPVNEGELQKAVLEEGDIVFTPPMMIHATKFLEDSVIWAFSTKPRGQEDYEEDTVRVKLVD